MLEIQKLFLVDHYRNFTSFGEHPAAIFPLYSQHWSKYVKIRSDHIPAGSFVDPRKATWTTLGTTGFWEHIPIAVMVYFPNILDDLQE